MLTDEEKKTYEELKAKLGDEDKPTFDDLLKEPNYQAEFDKKVQNAMAKNLEKEKAKWQKEAEEKASEAERLSKLSTEEKFQEQLNKALSEKKNAESQLNAYKLKEEAQKIATEKGLDINLLNIIDFDKETAETVKTKIEEIDESFKKAVETKTKERLRQPDPKQKASTEISGSEAKQYLDEKYKNNPYYKKG